MTGIAEESCETEIISQKYDFIEEIIEECPVGKSRKAEFTDRIDGVLTNRFGGVPIFLGIMACVFHDLCHWRLVEGIYGGRT